MKITHNNATSFTGIYRMPNTVKNLKEFETHVAPMYEYLKHEPTFIFEGKNPFKIGLDVLMDIIAYTQSSSTDWLRMNATRHGANLDEMGDDVCHIISGKKEFEKLIDYVQGRIEKRTSFAEKLKNMFNLNKSTYEDKPEHLRALFKALEFNNEENSAFRETYETRIVDVKTPKELLAKMLCERE